MKNLKAKLRKNGGFTLIEMLIVVAIIAILIAVSIPLVGGALNRARHATDQANERAAKAEILIQYLSGADAEVPVTADGATVYCYDAAEGTIIEAAAPTGTGHADYGKCTEHGHTGFIVMTIDADGTVEMGWNTSAAMPAASTLCSETTLS